MSSYRRNRRLAFFSILWTSIGVLWIKKSRTLFEHGPIASTDEMASLAEAQSKPSTLYESVLRNQSRFERALNSSFPPTIYICGSKDDELTYVIHSLFPEYKVDADSHKQIYWKTLIHQESTEYDLFVSRYWYACGDQFGHWLFAKFKGQYVWTTGESEPYPVSRPMGVPEDPRHHAFGPVKGGRYDYPLTYLQVVWWHTFKEQLPPSAMLDGNMRPKGNRTHFLVYGQANCVQYRDEAFGMLAIIGNAHQSGKCGAPSKFSGLNITRVDVGVSLRNWRDNVQHYSKYRFCLVMEHSHPYDYPYYVSEKILMAFVAGCVPIYYGPETIFDIFNSKSFVFYDVNNPTDALDLVQKMENDQKFYDDMISEPILANGAKTLEKYFSFSDDIANGWLKKKIRDVLNLPSYS